MDFGGEPPVGSCMAPTQRILGGMLAGRGQHTAEADVPVPVPGIVPVPVRRAQVPGPVVERTAAQHARRPDHLRPSVPIVDARNPRGQAR